MTSDAGKKTGGGLCVYVNNAWQTLTDNPRTHNKIQPQLFSQICQTPEDFLIIIIQHFNCLPLCVAPSEY